jgi:hypothetical protein
MTPDGHVLPDQSALHEGDRIDVSHSFHTVDTLRPYAAKKRDSLTDGSSSNVAAPKYCFNLASPCVSIR